MSIRFLIKLKKNPTVVSPTSNSSPLCSLHHTSNLKIMVKVDYQLGKMFIIIFPLESTPQMVLE